jgi:hypothetical protein
MNYNIDPNLDIEKTNLGFVSSDISNDVFKYYMECEYPDDELFKYAVYQAMNGEFDEIAICPFTGLVANVEDFWSGELGGWHDNARFWFHSSVYFERGRSIPMEDILMFCYSLYLQVTENPDTSWLNNEIKIGDELPFRDFFVSYQGKDGKGWGFGNAVVNFRTKDNILTYKVINFWEQDLAATFGYDKVVIMNYQEMEG